MVFVLDRDGAREVLREMAANTVIDVALEVAASAGADAVVESRVSKSRFVASIMVPELMQAKDGVLSRAASQAGLTIQAYKNAKKSTDRKRVIGFVSKRQWRWSFWSEQPWALGKARDTPGGKLIRYRQLPEATGRNTTPK
ncbi:MAG: hypothetical protein ACOYN7_10300 [Candidatus Nanopelagicales bacterium]